MRLKVLILDPTGLNPATWWRLYGPFNRIARHNRGNIDVRYSDGRGLLIQELALFDVVIFYITLNEGVSQLVAAAKDQGCKVVLDCDDDVFNLDPSTPEWQDYNRQRNHLTMNFRMADEIWFSTKTLCDSYKEIGAHRYVMPNAISPDLLPDQPNPKARRVLWRGSANHQIDYFHGADWYKDQEAWPDEWVWFGYCPPFVTRDNRNRFIGSVPPERYMPTLKAQKINYLWKPLRPCPQNDAKSNISWIEATIAGGVVVSNYAGRPGFEDCFSSFDDAETGRVEAWGRSKARIQDEFNINTINDLRLIRLSELTGTTL